MKRLIMLVICMGRLTPTKGVMINSSSRKPVIIIRGTPQFGFERFGVTVSFLMAMVIATPFAVLFGLGYGWLPPQRASG